MGRKKKSEEVLAETIAALDPAPEAVGAAGEIETKPRRNPTQPALLDVGDVHIQEVSDAALSYVNARDDRMAKLKEEKRLYTKLAGVMASHSLEEYHDRATGVHIDRDEPEEPRFKVKIALGQGEADAKFTSLTPDPDKPIGEDVMETPEENYGGTDEDEDEGGDSEPS